MKKLYLLAITVFACTFCNAQLTGTKTIPVDYPTLAAAITDLNTQGVGAGGVILNVLAGNPETAPAGGYVIGGTGSLVLTTSSAANPVVIQGNSNIITASAALTAGNLNDAIFKLVGADYITLTGFTMQENVLNTVTTTASNTMTEWGVALLYVTTTDGAQNNTIQNNTISLNRTYTNTFGIYSNVRHNATAVTTAADITAATGSNSGTKIYTNNISNVNYAVVFNGSSILSQMDVGTDIGGTSPGTGNTITNFGTAAAASSYVNLTGSNYAVFLNHQLNLNASYNNITSSVHTGTNALGGILQNFSVTGAITVTTTAKFDNNIITLSKSAASGGVVGVNAQGITSGPASSSIEMNNNQILNASLSGVANTASFTGLTNLSVVGTLNINNNIIKGITSAGTSGQLAGISNTGAVITSINIDNNHFGDAVTNYVTTSNTQSGTLFGISNGAGAATCALSISGNDITGISHTATTPTLAHTMIVNAGATLSQNISNNTFTNLTLKSTGSVSFINNSVTLPTGGSQTISGNRIVTAFSKTLAGGSVQIYVASTAPVSPAGTTHTANLNNFSNITVTGATVLTGWSNLEGAPGATKNITNNTFNNWTGGSSAVTGITTEWSGGGTISGNTITNITGTGVITGISRVSSGGVGAESISNNTISGLTSSGTGGNVIGINEPATGVSLLTISGNTINTLSSTGASSVIGIQYSSGTSGLIFKNNINNLSGSNASSVVSGIIVSSGTTTTVYNNIISDLRAPIANSATAIYGINNSVATPIGIYYNTVALGKSGSLTSTGAQFGVTGIGYNTTSAVTAKNNIIWVDATASGTALIVAMRKSAAGTAGTAPTAGNFTANSNIYNVQTPGVNKYLYAEGTTSANVKNGYGINIGIADDPINNLINDASFNTSCGKYKVFMTGGRESATFNEDNLSASGSPNFTFVPAGLSYAQNSGEAIGSPSITDDYSGAPRSSTPDMGALEFSGSAIDASAPIITFTNLANTACLNGPVLNVQISDVSGVNTTAGTAPRLYFRKTTENDVFLNYPGENNSSFNGWKYVEATGSAPNFTFTFNYSLLTAAVALGDNIAYFIAAQDNNGVPNAGVKGVTLAAGFCPSSVVLPALAGPTTLNTTYSLTTVGATYTTVANGDWQTAGTWSCGLIPPSNTSNVVIANNITITTTGNVAANVTINTGATLTMNAGADLTTGTVGGGNTVFTDNGSLNITGGTLNVNGNVQINNAANFSQSGGLFSIDGNTGTAATSVASGTAIFAIGTAAANYSTGSINLTGGTTQIVDPHAGATATTAQAFTYYGAATPANNINTGANYFFQFGDGISTTSGGHTSGFFFNQWEISGGFKPNLVINTAAGTNRAVTSVYSPFSVQNLTILKGEFIAPTLTNIEKDLTVSAGGTLTTTGTIQFATGIFSGTSLVTSASTIAQAINGGGVIRNLSASPTANLTSLTLVNTSTSGLTLNTPISVSGTLTMTSGNINNPGANVLTLGTGPTVGGTLTYTAGQITGSFKRWITAAVGSRQFPLGTATNLKNAVLNFTTAPTTAGSLTAIWSPVPPAAPAPALVEPVGTLTVNAVSQQGSWFIDAADGLTGGLYTTTFTANGTTDIIDYTKTVLIKRPSAGGAWILDGTHIVSTGSNSAPTLSRTGMSGFSEFAIGGQAVTVVPVSIEFFRGSKIAGADYLNWKVTCTSAPSVRLVLERSGDGKNFSTINDQIATAVRCLQDFSYTDASPLAGMNYYRLKIITPDGAARYSTIVLLLNKDKGFEFVNLAPNPSKGASVLTVTTAKAGKMDISVTDVTGKVIMKQTVVMIAGSNAVNMNFAALNAGTYQVTGISSDGEVNTIRFVKY